MADVNFKGGNQYRRFPLRVTSQDIEDSPVGEIVAKIDTRIFANLLPPNGGMRRI